MKILYVINDTLRHGGTESVILNYYNHIDRSEIQIDFVLNAPKSEISENDICKYLISKGSKIYCITPRRESQSSNKKEFLEILKNNEYDVVHTHTDAVGSYFLKLAKEAGVGIRIAHSHNTKHQLINKGIKNRIHFTYLEKCRKDIRKEATHFMACSKEAGVWLFGEENVSCGKVYVLNNAINIEKYAFNKEARDRVRKELGFDSDLKNPELVIGHIGGFRPQKNHAFLLDVFKEVSNQNEKARLLLVGSGKLEQEIKDKTKELGLSSKVIFYGETDKAEEVINAMDIFAFPSLYEGLGLVMIEAQCNGLKCFLTDSEEVSKESMITKQAESVKLDNPSIWAEKILNANTNRIDVTDDIRKSGYDIVTEAKKLEDYYKSLL